MLRAFALKRQDRVDHVLDDAGPGDLSVLGDVADQNNHAAGALGEADEFGRRAAHLRHRSWRGFNGLRPHGLNRIDHSELRRFAVRQRGDDILD